MRTILFATPCLYSKRSSEKIHPTMTLRTFLRLPRHQPPAHVVLGNEASDLDSVASAIGYAYLNRAKAAFIPVINIPRSQLHLRRDVLDALALANLNPDDLTFVDAMPCPTSLTLVDHNALASHQSHLAEYVSAVVDHHADENIFKDAEPRIIAPVGSCASLVSEISESDIDIARLLLCAIMIDCGNMAPGGKGTSRDANAVERLSRIARWDSRERESIYLSLKAARKDISGLSVKDLLYKDMKVVEAVGKRVAVSTVTISAWDLVKRGEPLTSDLKNFQSELEIDCVIVMNSYGGSDGHRREICILHNELGERLAQGLLTEDRLLLNDVNINGADGLFCLQQAFGNCPNRDDCLSAKEKMGYSPKYQGFDFIPKRASEIERTLLRQARSHMSWLLVQLIRITERF